MDADMNKRPIIIDTDPGIDDAVAIAIALFLSLIHIYKTLRVNFLRMICCCAAIPYSGSFF